MEKINKKCSSCEEVKAISLFTRIYRKNKNGSKTGDGYRSQCKTCCNLQRKLCYDKKPITRMYMNAKARARKLNIEFNLEYGDLDIPLKCPILEVPLVLGTANNYEFAPSIDRINSNKGYTKDNVKIISLMANRMKNNATKEQCVLFAKNILKYYDDIV